MEPNLPQNSYFVTLSPPTKRDGFKPKVRHHYYKLYEYDAVLIHRAFNRGKIPRYYFIPEISDKGRLHYHGIMTCTKHEMYSWYRETQNALAAHLGFVDVKLIKNFEDHIRIQQYIRKNRQMTCEIIETDEIITGKALTPYKRKVKHIKEVVREPVRHYVLDQAYIDRMQAMLDAEVIAHHKAAEEEAKRAAEREHEDKFEFIIDPDETEYHVDHLGREYHRYIMVPKKKP